jgi:serine protease Do
LLIWLVGLVAICLVATCLVAVGLVANSAVTADDVPSKPLASQADSDPWLAGAIEYAQARMVKVFGAGAGRVNSYASGIVVSADGHILTMQGVFLDGDQVRVALPDGELVTASTLRRDRQYQLALLKIDRPTPEYFPLSDQPVGKKGDWVVALSNAFMVAEREEPMSATLGVISLPTSIEARINQALVAYRGELILIDAITSNPGAGGGAVVSVDQQLVGMIGKVISSSETNTRLNYAVPSHVLRRFLAGEPLDTAPEPATSTEPATLGLELFKLGGHSGPAYIDRLVPGGPAEAAGLKPDDLIVSVGGEKVGSIREFERLVPKLQVGKEIVLVVKRGTDLLRLPITPAAIQ